MWETNDYKYFYYQRYINTRTQPQWASRNSRTKTGLASQLSSCILTFFFITNRILALLDEGKIQTLCQKGFWRSISWGS